VVRAGALDLAAQASLWLPDWPRGPFADVRARDLLEHASGLPAWQPLYLTFQPSNPTFQPSNLPTTASAEIRARIASLEPEYLPRSQSIYSDLGFLVLGHAIESAGGRPLDALFETFREEEGLPASLRYGAQDGVNVAPTEFDSWRGRMPVGEVHDENAFALGGIAPHAGLFGTAAAVGMFARLVLRTFTEDTALGSPSLMALFAARSRVPGSSRALGWDTMLPTSSCGSRMSSSAIGHTGFTGTSLWIDPVRDRYYVLLANRVHPSRENNAIRQVRRDFHDAFGA
jgi:CubicO group peptidase (beta-lactamase class C family)